MRSFPGVRGDAAKAPAGEGPTAGLHQSGCKIWRTYILLTRVESAFRTIKSPLLERPVFHQFERRVETHIFLCVLACHLLVCVEKTFRDQGIYTS
jgi:transposase